MRPNVSPSAVAGISDTFLRRFLRSVSSKIWYVLGRTPASCEFFASMSRIASLTAFPTSAPSGRRNRWSKRATGVEDARCLIRRGVIDARTTTAFSRPRLQRGSLREKPHLGEAQKDQAEDGLGVLGGGET